MKAAIEQRPQHRSGTQMRVVFRCVLASALVAALLPGTVFGADATPPKDSQASRPHLRRTAKRPAFKTQQAVPAVAEAAPAVEAPPAPLLPDWPVNDHPKPARVVWDSHGLRVEASNSSLDQILHEVAADTGAKVEGMNQDQRIFGNFGPGPARDVLTQLLDGSGYNLLLIGDMGQGTPRQIVLSTRSTGSGQPAARQSRPQEEEDTAEEPDPQPEPVQMQPQPQPQPQQMQGNPFGGGGAPRSPQEIMQEMQQRQQQMQQQQQQQQQ